MNQQTTHTDQTALDNAIAMMRADDAEAYQIEHFSRQFAEVSQGFDGIISEDSIDPLTDPVVLGELSAADNTTNEYHVASLKLNGGLGTTMGLEGPKSLLPVKGDATFLSIVLQQYNNGHQGDELILMNSFHTNEKIISTLQADKHDIVSFEQGRIPRLSEADLQPLDPNEWGNAAWCPPGHGQVLYALTNGLAASLLSQGIRYLFISNIDNLGATVDRSIPAYMAANNITWLNEVCERGPLDIKGGHVARLRSDHRLIVRDSNMTSKDDMGAFTDITKHRYFNTNNIWIDLEAIAELTMDSSNDLPMIVNHKEISNGTETAKVIQLETGIGTGIHLFKNSQALLVSRSRFIPVKDTPQWLLLRSNWFTLQADGRLTESDPMRRPLIDAAKVSRGTAKQTLRYYLEQTEVPDLQDILQ